MDTKESKTPEEQKEHIIGERVPEDLESSKPHLQPEAKKRPGGMYKLLPLVIIILGVIVVSIIVLGIINRGN
ncbi:MULTISPECIES: hypothetical protein [Vreelandella]|uniref:Uncharacterized protein n=1 Tax=Vreelandella maris TaxID=2729617 RepID=A0A7Y6V6W1_9GAMM|nr:hypothetical protein [Halomonas maris]NVF12614.1 hypothetical protein [Halomonas maris]|tara:strand:- start:100335 stop:100550 length:216 start_codon:yes stop_codon:yes gene_type:complete